MKGRNADVRSKVEKNKKVFTAIRRSDVAMQFRSCMASKGIRSVDIADRLGVSEANVSRWLKGNQNVGIDTLYLLADAIEEPLTLIIGSGAFEEPTVESSTSKQHQWTRLRLEGTNVVDIACHSRFFASRPRHIHENFKPLRIRSKDLIDGETNERAAASA